MYQFERKRQDALREAACLAAQKELVFGYQKRYRRVDMTNHCLNGRSPGPDHRHSILLPLFCLIVLRPFRRVNYLCKLVSQVAMTRDCHYFALESFNALYFWPFIVVEDASPIKKHMASFFEFFDVAIVLLLFDFDQPLARVILPICASNFTVEVHVFAQTPDFADLVEVFPDIGRVGEEPRPVRLMSSSALSTQMLVATYIQGERVGVGVAGNVAGRAWKSQPVTEGETWDNIPGYLFSNHVPPMSGFFSYTTCSTFSQFF